MKKTFTFSKIAFAALALFLVVSVSAQIADLDPSKYYMIMNHGLNGVSAERGGIGKNAIAVDDNHFMEEGALIQQQMPNQFMFRQLWKIVPITESTYYFINFGTGMALGLSDWRGENPFWDGPTPSTLADRVSALTVPAFTWTGTHRAAVQRAFNPGDETQIWQPTQFPTNSTSGDTVFYRMTLAMHLIDSGLCFNVWERFTFPGFRNICIFPGTQEASLYDDVTSLYGFYFVKTTLSVSATGDYLMENIHTYSSNGSIILRGELYGKQVEIYTILGTKVYSTLVNSSELNVPVRNGFYIVKAGNMITKLFVE